MNFMLTMRSLDTFDTKHETANSSLLTEKHGRDKQSNTIIANFKYKLGVCK